MWEISNRGEEEMLFIVMDKTRGRGQHVKRGFVVHCKESVRGVDVKRCLCVERQRRKFGGR